MENNDVFYFEGQVYINFFWQGQEVFSESFELQLPLLGAQKIIDLFDTRYDIDVQDYNLHDILIDGTTLKVHLKSESDFRQVQLYKLNLS
jgi:hypothetical protein